MTTKGPSFIWDSTTPFVNGFVWDTLEGLGMAAQSIPTTGTDGSPPWYSSLVLPSDIDSEIRVTIETPPTIAGGLLLDGAGGFTYSGRVRDSFVWRGYQDGPSVGTAVVALSDGTVSSVTGVTVSPATATGSQVFTATVLGSGASQTVTWSASAGVITSGGAFTAPAQTTSVQTVTITARSQQDPIYSGVATVTIAALDVDPPPVEPPPDLTVPFVLVFSNGRMRRQAT